MDLANLEYSRIIDSLLVEYPDLREIPRTLCSSYASAFEVPLTRTLQIRALSLQLLQNKLLVDKLISYSLPALLDPRSSNITATNPYLQAAFLFSAPHQYYHHIYPVLIHSLTRLYHVIAPKSTVLSYVFDAEQELLRTAFPNISSGSYYSNVDLNNLAPTSDCLTISQVLISLPFSSNASIASNVDRLSSLLGNRDISSELPLSLRQRLLQYSLKRLLPAWLGTLNSCFGLGPLLLLSLFYSDKNKITVNTTRYPCVKILKDTPFSHSLTLHD